MLCGPGFEPSNRVGFFFIAASSLRDTRASAKLYDHTPSSEWIVDVLDKTPQRGRASCSSGDQGTSDNMDRIGDEERKVKIQGRYDQGLGKKEAFTWHQRRRRHRKHDARPIKPSGRRSLPSPVSYVGVGMRCRSRRAITPALI